MTETVEIREDPTWTPYCVVCKKTLGENFTTLSAANIVTTRHELKEHPDPEEEDA
jgi:hypothetical protein